jgi:hypothetical protein
MIGKKTFEPEGACDIVKANAGLLVVVLRPAASASPGSWLKIHICGSPLGL